MMMSAVQEGSSVRESEGDNRVPQEEFKGCVSNKLNEGLNGVRRMLMMDYSVRQLSDAQHFPPAALQGKARKDAPLQGWAWHRNSDLAVLSRDIGEVIENDDSPHISPPYSKY